MSGTKLLLFDLGGVLVDYTGTRDLLGLLSVPHTRESLHELWLKTDVWFRFEMGRCTPEEFAETLTREWPLACTASEFLVQFESWTRSLYPGAREVLAELRPRYRLAALSNSNETHWRRNIEDLGVGALFERAFSSHELGMRKPERAIYEQALRELGVAAGEAVFFDDLAENVQAARDVGMTAHRVRGVEELRASLVENGLL